jgi:DNA processing protein
MTGSCDGWRIDRGDPGYPECLESTPQPPEILWGMGDPLLLRPGLAVIGARRATPYGLSCARMFAGWAAEHGVVVVSGGAVGCDRAAHEAALEADGATVAVLGCGPDVDYPRDGDGLMRRIRESGAVIAELPWGVGPRAYHFPKRNRLIAGLAKAVLVVEAALPSGTFSTADHALAADREVWAVPGSVLYSGCRGSNTLLTQGALPICDVSDLATALTRLGLCRDAFAQACVLPRATDRLAAALLADPMRPDDAAFALRTDVVTVMRQVSALEQEGVVRRYPDGRYGPP